VPGNGVHEFNGFEGQFQHGGVQAILIIEIIDHRVLHVSTYDSSCGEILSSPEH